MPIKQRWMKFTRENVEKLPKGKTGVYEIANRNKSTIYIGGSKKSGIGVRGRLIDHIIKNKFPTAKYFRYAFEDFLGLDDGIDMERKHSQKFVAKHGRKPAHLKRSPKEITNIFMKW